MLPGWIRPIADLVELPMAGERYLVDQLLAMDGTMLIHGVAGSGKSTLVLDLAASLATGSPFLGRYGVPRPFKVMILQAEMSVYDIREHGQWLIAAYPSLSGGHRDNLQISDGAVFRAARSPEDLEARVRDSDTEVLAIDPLLNYFRGGSMNESSDVGPILDGFDQLLERVDGLKAIVVVHHSPKSQIFNGRLIDRSTPLGSVAFEAWPSTLLRLESPARQSRDRSLVVVKSRAPMLRQNARLELRLADGGYQLLNSEESDLRVGGRDHRVRRVEAMLARPGGATRAELIRGARLTATELDRALASFGNQLEHRRDPTGGRPVDRYSLRAQSEAVRDASTAVGPVEETTTWSGRGAEKGTVDGLNDDEDGLSQAGDRTAATNEEEDGRGGW